MDAWFQFAIASTIADRVDRPELSDEEALTRMMEIVRRGVLNPHQFDHASLNAPVLFSGIGYCDQVNGAVCSIAINRFPRAEVFALRDPATGLSSHSIGRVWSPQRKQWLYFDAFYEEPVMFTRAEAGQPKFLNVAAARHIPGRGETNRSLYALQGSVLNAYRRSFGSYLLTKVNVTNVQVPAQATSQASAVPPQSPIRGGSVAGPLPIVDPSSVHEEAYPRLARAYVSARMTHLLEGSARGYANVTADPDLLRDPRARRLVEVARLFSVGVTP